MMQEIITFSAFARMINFRCKIGKSIQSGTKCIKLDEIEVEDLKKIPQYLDDTCDPIMVQP